MHISHRSLTGSQQNPLMPQIAYTKAYYFEVDG